MKILLVSATNIETNTIRKQLVPNNNKKNKKIEKYFFEDIEIDILITGVSIPFCIYYLTKTLQNAHYDLAIQHGIAGAFNYNLTKGEVYNVSQEIFADIGIYEKQQFFPFFEKGLADKNHFPFNNGYLINPTPINKGINRMKSVNGLTINTIETEQDKITYRKEKFNADIETMEGAAFFYVCMNEKVPFFEIRGISNYVEERDINKWEINLATENISEKLISIFKELTKQL